MPQIDSSRLAQVVADPTGFTVTGLSAANAAQTLTQNPNPGEAPRISGFEVTLSGPGAPTEITVNVLGSGAAVIHQSFVASGATAGIIRDFTKPLTVGVGATVQLYVGPGGASIRSAANFRGLSLRDATIRS